MRKLNRLELLVIKAALLLDDYAYNYNHSEYINKVGNEEFFRVRHVNDLIDMIANDYSELQTITKQIVDDIEFIAFDINDPDTFSELSQLCAAYEILDILNELN